MELAIGILVIKAPLARYEDIVLDFRAEEIETVPIDLVSLRAENRN
jgi:hypothetical protein